MLSLRLNRQAGLTFGGVVLVDTVHWSGLENTNTRLVDELHAVGRTHVFGCFDLERCRVPNHMLACVIVFFDLYGHLEGTIFFVFLEEIPCIEHRIKMTWKGKMGFSKVFLETKIHVDNFSIFEITLPSH